MAGGPTPTPQLFARLPQRRRLLGRDEQHNTGRRPHPWARGQNPRGDEDHSVSARRHPTRPLFVERSPAGDKTGQAQGRCQRCSPDSGDSVGAAPSSASATESTTVATTAILAQEGGRSSDSHRGRTAGGRW
ncbi:MAG: hypothetical protein AVDCRST_MAG59-1452 [uncultured Thermomicrobiales bacterium]|uniref:Uncharacterized protein n=1 Tax=uncultured Thermomicrobiales bacterium TaxID=1645740 RepID=A0A6J4UDT5_9BACT|nr:MAG: hypothetical protein AVDCRST_MAG59-1452 [uncultured Thermomicrobiales bacterium]